jgi:hypothetical protein
VESFSANETFGATTALALPLGAAPCLDPFTADRVTPVFVLTGAGAAFFTTLTLAFLLLALVDFSFDDLRPLLFVFKALPLPWDGWLVAYNAAHEGDAETDTDG